MKDFKFKIDGTDYTASVAEKENGSLEVTVNGKAYQVELPEAVHAPHPTIHHPAASAAAPVATPQAATGGSNTISAPLPGTITKVVVSDGQKVKKGDVLVIMEAMKMANDIVAEADGTIKKVVVTVGQSVNQGEALVEFQADAQAAPAAPAAKPAAAPVAPQTAPAAPKPAAGASCVTAPLPGTITKILVKAGDQVNAGDTVLVLEAMKMENNITAESAGTVKSVLVEQGAQVQGGDALVEIA